MQARLALMLVVALAACTEGVRARRRDKLQYDDPPAKTASAAPAPSATPSADATVDASGKLGKICTKIGCQDRYAVTFATRSGAPPLGMYEIAITADGKKLSCKVDISKKGKAASCEGEGARPAITSPAGGDPTAPLLTTIELESAPASVEVVVKRTGATLSRSTITPSYKTLQPNGPDCSPTCKQGEDRIAL